MARDARINNFLGGLYELKPVNDNPAGLMHNYMARKPYNVVSSIISEFVPEGGVVYDPMAGSGTTLIEASKLGVTGIGADVNPVAQHLMEVSLADWDIEAVGHLFESYLQELKDFAYSVYSFSQDDEVRIIERCHFSWTNGALEPKEYWYKVLRKSGDLGPRKKDCADQAFIEEYETYDKSSIHFIADDCLITNIRIAIPDGRSVYDYFCARNLTFLDYALEKLSSFKDAYGYEALELLLSSSINLIKLSDKKASSQIPYWIPKQNVTSRNAFLILENKCQKVLAGLTYLKEKKKNSLQKSYDKAECGHGCLVYRGGAQFIPDTILPDGVVDLVLTDPPYTDQVPYVEYGQLTASLLGWSLDDALNDELVVSDAPSRNKTTKDFETIFEAILKRTQSALKEKGYFALFYHSFDLKSWAYIVQQMSEYNLHYLGQTPLRAPRKSFKTVMSPGRTLDGNYLLMFQKETRNSPKRRANYTLDEAVVRVNSVAKTLLEEHGKLTPQELYDNGLLTDAIEEGYLSVLASKYKSFVQCINVNTDE